MRKALIVAFSLICLGDAFGSGSLPLRVSIRRDTYNADPLSSNPTLQILPDLFLALYRPSSDGSHFFPALAENAPVRIKGAFGSTGYHVRLRAAKWSDGTPITSDDVGYTFSVIEKDHKSSLRELICDSQGCWAFKKINRLEFQLFSRKYPEAMLDRLSQIFIVPQASHKKKSFLQNPVVSGAYKVKTWVHQRAIELIANPHAIFPPQTKRKIYFSFQDLNSIAQAASGGRLDIAYAAPEHQRRFKRSTTKYIAKYPYPSAVSITINRARFNQEQSQQIYKCLEFIQKEYLRRVVFFGYHQEVKIANTYWHPDIPFSKGLKEKANPSSSTPTCNIKNSLTILTEAGFEEYQKVLSFVKNSLQKTGINLKFRFVSPSSIREWLNFRKSNKVWDLYLGEWPASRSKYFPDFSAVFGEFPTDIKYSENIASYQNNKVQQLVKALLVSPAHQRTKILEELQLAFLSDLPSFPLYFIEDAFILGKNVTIKGFKDCRASCTNSTTHGMEYVIKEKMINHVMRWYPETIKM